MRVENTMIDTNFIQAIDKQFDRMDAKELRRERAAHLWEANKLHRGIYVLNQRIRWLEENLKLIDMEDIKRKRERGEISAREYKSLCGLQGKRLQTYRATEDKIEYANRLETHERAIVKLIEERIEDIESRPKRNKTGPKRKDPRKKAGWYNPKADWVRTQPHVRPPKKLKPHTEKWETIRAQNVSASVAMNRMQPIEQWNFNKLKLIAQDRGYYSDLAIVTAVSDAMDLSINSAKKLLETGKMSWGQCIVIGALFEMTPSEFCDVFLSGYFKEVADGKWVAYVEDKMPLLTAPTDVRPSYNNFHPTWNKHMTNEPNPVGEDEERVD